MSKLRSLAARRHPDVVVWRRYWRSHAGRKRNGNTKLHLRRTTASGRLSRVRTVPRKLGQKILGRPDKRGSADAEPLHQSYIEQVNVNREFRPFPFLRTVRYVHLVPQLVRGIPNAMLERDKTLSAPTFLNRLLTVPEKIRSSRLRKIGAALKVAVPNCKTLNFIEIQQTALLICAGTTSIGVRWELGKLKGNSLTERFGFLGFFGPFSIGQGLYYLRSRNSTFTLKSSRYLPQMFATMQRRAGRQVIISTHSADLLQRRRYRTGRGLVAQA